MKKILIVLLLLSSQLLLGQVTSTFNYQGLLLNAAGNGVNGKIVDFIVSISDADQNPTVYYSEAQEVQTDENGIFNFVIGMGTPLSGTIEAVDWLSSVPYLNISYDLNDGKGERILGATRFSAVPFALYSKYIYCLPGEPGPQGVVGAVGAIGMPGPRGPDGNDGARGAQGRQGEPGAANLPILAAEPTNSVEGTIYLDDGTNREDSAPGFRYYDGAGWIDL